MSSPRRVTWPSDVAALPRRSLSRRCPRSLAGTTSTTRTSRSHRLRTAPSRSRSRLSDGCSRRRRRPRKTSRWESRRAVRRNRSSTTAPASTPACSPRAGLAAGTTEGYRLAGHPLQDEILAEVAAAAELEPSELETAVDGCGVVSLRASARAGRVHVLAARETAREAAASPPRCGRARSSSRGAGQPGHRADAGLARLDRENRRGRALLRGSVQADWALP